ncbi:UDP-N-acetylmuramoyl-L-alanyl-D-glutamate--2,6-diaminopimelate ligase [Conexibacter sp. DBS9H8]|uniref:UDP-N-acetylmuramoyl-L-alanyl-D-glutamate--2, 6-diaminopimelate ligase n=1 Tax=Conexibacter sp. DBS9H8 TaxID=2937801 RepID=UPI00200CE81B|nr:UDP-N-acetylmuramoyl-L-alanyl-D-glutamate--2,6-diaminopimelate ligase [Conexibacter sp. DBS9H8]
MQLGELFDPIPVPGGGPEIVRLDYDHRRVAPGSLFFCVRGFTSDGHAFAPAAAASGAVAIVVDHRVDGLALPQVVVEDVRAAMGPAASRFFGDPTREFAVTGVTGTNGKTTTATLIRSLLEADGRQTGLLGTVTSIIGGTAATVSRTTPEAVDLQQSFREMVSAGDRAAAIEVSSHALDLHRVDGVHFTAAVFTNLTQDHLDFHQTMEAYFQAKRRLFSEHAPEVAIFNLDDPYGVRLAAEFGGITFAIDNPRADVRADHIDSDIHGTRFTLRTPEGEEELRSPLRGRFNVANVLAALAAAHSQGVPLSVSRRAIASAGQVPGRFQTVDAGQPFAVIVDYAHTPDSLHNVLLTARALTTGRVHVVFGCGGDRDRGKRPLMGEIAVREADHVIITSDNPRSEDPAEIIAEIVAPIPGRAEVEVDRARAIHSAIASAEAGDIVLIAGKGHEQGQEFAGGRKLPFDDLAVAREALGAVQRHG